MSWIISATLVTAAFFIFVVGKGIRAQFKPVQRRHGNDARPNGERAVAD